MKKFSGVLGAILLVTAGHATAQDETSKSTVFPQGWYVAPMFSFTKADKSRQTGNGIGAVLALGHRSDIAAIEIEGLYTRLPVNGGSGSGTAQLTGGELALVVGPFFEQDILSRFFGVVGFGILKEKNVPAMLQPATSSLAGEAGLGYLQPLRLWGLRMNLRSELRYRYDYQEPPHPAGAAANFQDLVLNVGVQVPLSREEEPASRPPVTVVPAAVGDSDQDGVPDDHDQCPNTPAGSYVNNVGCPKQPEAVVAPAVTPEADEGPVTLENAKVGDTIVLTGVTFEFNSSRLTSNAKVILDPVARQLLQRSELRIEVGGHTDGKGSAAYNQKLSERRAKSVESYLEQQGVDAARLSAKGYGMAQPVDTNETEEGREHNRRVEMKVLE